MVQKYAWYLGYTLGLQNLPNVDCGVIRPAHKILDSELCNRRIPHYLCQSETGKIEKK